MEDVNYSVLTDVGQFECEYRITNNGLTLEQAREIVNEYINDGLESWVVVE